VIDAVSVHPASTDRHYFW